MADYYVSNDGKITKKGKKSSQTVSYKVSSNGKVTKVTTKKKKKKDEDIAPVKKTTGGNKNSWFKSGGFSDGVTGVGDFFGDLGETILGTVGDVGVGVGKGITRMGEGIVDLGSYGVAEVADRLGKDKYATNLRKKAIKDWTTNAWKKAEDKVDKYSILGNKSDGVTEGLGQVLAILGTGGLAGAAGAGAGVAAAITTGATGLSSMGSGMSEAYRSGATDKEAFTYGAIAGTAEAATELLFGGLGKSVKALGLSKGLSSADDMLAKKISSKFTNQIAKNFTEFGIKAGAEGTEEVLSGIAQAVGKKVTYMSDKELSQLIEDEDLLDQFIVGSITSGIAQSGYVPGMTQGSLREANKSGTDFITGLSQNEQKVVDKEYENRIKEATEEGKKLSTKEKNKIYDEVVNDLEKGYISTDTIESAIGGKTYETYKNMTERENAVKKEIEELENKPFSQITVKEQEKLTELRKQLETMEKSGLKNKVRSQLSSEVSELAIGNKLSESYNEQTRRSQAFQADITKYDAKQQDTIKKATESGILNNSNRTHEFVDLVAKISADKGVTFDFTNNKKLKESGVAVEGKTVNGYVKDGNIAVNIDSNKSLNSIVGHEITHTLEGTEHYNELQNAVKEYAKTKGEYDTRFNELSEMYKDVEGSNVENELTADLVGDYLFTDKDFINNLSTEKPNIFKRIYDEIKYLCKIATAGSKEARQLEKVKRAFDKAYKEAKANAEVNTDTNVDTNTDTKAENKTTDDKKYSLSDSDGKTLTEAQQEYFKDSKVRDENGNLKVMYHGTESAGFHEFSNRFSDDGRSFFFVDTNEGAKGYSGTHETYEAKTLHTAEDVNNFFEEINQDEYEVTEEDGEFVLYEDGDEIARSDSAKGIYDEFCDWTGLGFGSANYKVYLNIKNPLVVDAKNNNWDELDLSEFTGEDSENYNNTREFSEYAKEKGYDGVIFKNIIDTGLYASGMERFAPATVAVAFDSNQIKSVANEKPTTDEDIRYSMSNKGQNIAPYGNYNVYGKDVALKQDFAPTFDDIAPLTEEQANTRDDEFEKLVQSYMDEAPGFLFDDEDIRAWAEEQARQNPQGMTKENTVVPESPLDKDRDIYTIGKERKTNAYMYENPEVKPFFQDEARTMLWELQNSTRGKKERMEIDSPSDEGWYGTHRHTSDEIAYLLDTFKYKYNDITKGLMAIIEDNGAENNAISKRIEFMLDDRLREGYTDFMSGQKMPPNQDYVNLLNEKQITEYSEEARSAKLAELDAMQNIAPLTEEQANVRDAELEQAPVVEPVVKDKYKKKAKKKVKEVIETPATKLENAETEIANLEQLKQDSYDSYTDKITKLQNEYEAKKNKDTKVANNILRRIERLSRSRADVDADYSKRLENANKRKDLIKRGHPTARSEVHRKIMDNVKAEFSKKGYDFDKVLENAKNLSTFATVDNTPQRVMNKALGYKEGNILSDITVNKIAQNESEGIKWLDGYTNRKTGVLAQLVNEYKIKPGSKESAAAQMYAEGFYVDDDNKVIKYGDEELAKDFPNEKVRNRIKGLASDPKIRQIYDDTLNAINDSRLRNVYPEIPKRKDYFLHFRAMDDTFSKLGLPFNPNDIRAKDLPTDLNGVTADLEPGQPYFASAKRRMGKKTSHDLLGGLERYLTSAKNQIYHIDDIQNLRALRNYIADKYGQAHGLEDISGMTEEEFQERIAQVYNSHLSTFAKFLNEEANVIAGKTSLMDRGLEGLIGRRALTFLNTVNKQVGSNMVGLNVSSAGTNFLPVVETFARTNKADFFKAFTQTASNKISSIFGKSDGFMENNPTMLRRNGADVFYRTPYQKVADAGQVLMGAVDNISTELIVRTKYNEYVRKGMSHEEAVNEADKWASRTMGDRSLGQQPQLFNSKAAGLITKFQLEVRNLLDSQFYDTIQESKASNEEVQNKLLRNAKTSAKMASTFTQLAVAQHLFGTAFEKVVGYNPAFDVVETLIKVFGFDDEEDSEDTVLDNIEQGFLNLLEDLPYASVITGGGRIPISSALPIKEFVYGEDEYGEKPRGEILAEALPYYLLPTGYGQIKKTVQGLSMFDDDLPISGSYTESGSLRFPIEDTTENKIKAGLFGQWANENARTYFNNDIAPLKEKQIKEFIDVDMPINDYWEYREGLKEQKKLEDKFDYIDSLDLPVKKKNILINNIVNRKEDVDMENYGDFSSYEEFDFYSKYPEKYNFLQENNISYKDYTASEESRDAYNWAFNNPEKYTLSKAISKDVVAYRSITKGLYEIRADKDKNGKAIVGTAKEKKIKYINSLDIDYGERLVLFKSEYNSDDTYNNEIINYLNSREDITYEEQETILKQLGFTVTADGNIYWD